MRFFPDSAGRLNCEALPPSPSVCHQQIGWQLLVGFTLCSVSSPMDAATHKQLLGSHSYTMHTSLTWGVGVHRAKDCVLWAVPTLVKSVTVLTDWVHQEALAHYGPVISFRAGETPSPGCLKTATKCLFFPGCPGCRTKSLGGEKLRQNAVVENKSGTYVRNVAKVAAAV